MTITSNIITVNISDNHVLVKHGSCICRSQYCCVFSEIYKGVFSYTGQLITANGTPIFVLLL